MSERKSIESISHGRGGAGNIGADDTPYADGEIVREGLAGDHGDGPYSSGRGGVANIGSPGLAAAKRNDKEVIPAEALRDEEDTNHHVGRGGQGNVHVAKEGGKPHPTGLADKLKAKLFGKKVKGETA
ncbi:hypothetical protein VC83_07037 [Pseudogymnoascus destructans]|uniref:Uncharacterized protein n=2 Tax=Pseudogymnoascus destructans TaxID=655981 RepID=L8G3C9_PSED2|nr:uncharacterized protein VC83_07037 [Pseudogymnoascus destructans]ELR07349.1 hypothetical protein GMDG_08365 [Pseudogymnoascus destructans 20631-21]OAF56867.1 hypothetical protein VC83_07037 [Pseudogymnoascus destructans]